MPVPVGQQIKALSLVLDEHRRKFHDTHKVTTTSYPIKMPL